MLLLLLLDMKLHYTVLYDWPLESKRVEALTEEPTLCPSEQRDLTGARKIEVSRRLPHVRLAQVNAGAKGSDHQIGQVPIISG